MKYSAGRPFLPRGLCSAPVLCSAENQDFTFDALTKGAATPLEEVQMFFMSEKWEFNTLLCKEKWIILWKSTESLIEFFLKMLARSIKA